MSLSSETLNVLKNFASINQGLLFKPGNRLRTLSVLKNVFAVAEINDEITREFAIYDLNEFLGTISLFSKPHLTFNEDHILIQDGKTKVKYFYSSPAVVVSPPDKDIVLTDPKLTFELTEGNINQIQKAAATLKLKELSIREGKLTALNSGGVGNQITIELDTEGSMSDEKLVKIENLKLIEGSYNVKVFDQAVEFAHMTKPGLVYLVTVEAK
ncbi:DNA polymerase sliding clamp [Xanthomonas phage BUDD]|nr:DNA polymerase sliding clamp [Xanthomonas phage BUDD]